MKNFLENLFYKKNYVHENSIYVKGTEYDGSKSSGDFITREMIINNPDVEKDYRENWFSSDQKIILGVNRKISSEEVVENGDGCSVVWDINVESLSKKRVVKALLVVKTSSANTGLHTPKDLALQAIQDVHLGKRKHPRSALIKINGTMLDRIDILAKMNTTLDLKDIKENAEDLKYLTFAKSYSDYGVNKVEPYDITKFIKPKMKTLTLCIEVDDFVYWDIDELIIDNIICQDREIRPFWWMIFGTIVSIFAGIISAPFTQVSK